MFKCENPKTSEARILRAFRKGGHASGHGRRNLSTTYEHGQHWVLCVCGAAWSVVDAEGGDGFDFEPVSTGDEDYHR